MLNRNKLRVYRLFFCFILLSAFTGTAPVQKANHEQEVLKFTNEFRKSKGKLPLILNEELCIIARKHSADMASGKKSVGHSGFNQREVLIRQKLKSSVSVGENVAFGAATGKEAVTLWKNSTEHRRNLLGNYKYIGIGAVSNRTGHIYFTQIFVR